MTVAKVLVTGDFDYSNDWNTYQSWHSNTTVQLDNALQCSDCWASFGLDVHFAVDLADYHLNALTLMAEGDVGTNVEVEVWCSTDMDLPEFNIQTKVWLEQSWSNSGSLPILDLEWLWIVFTIGAVPVTLKITVPVAETWKLEASGNLTITASVQAQGHVQYGITYTDGQFVPINTHTYSQQGQISELQLGTFYIPPMTIYSQLRLLTPVPLRHRALGRPLCWVAACPGGASGLHRLHQLRAQSLCRGVCGLQIRFGMQQRRR